MGWATPPYYVAPPIERVYCGPFYRWQAHPESMLQQQAQAMLAWPSGFVIGANGTGDQTPESLTKQYVDYAVMLNSAPFAADAWPEFKPEERGTYYANLVIETLKTIPANAQFGWNGTDSVYDVWTHKEA